MLSGPLAQRTRSAWLAAVILGFWLGPLTGLAARAQDQAQGALVFDERAGTFVDTYQFNEVSHSWRFRNEGTRPVRVLEALAVSSGDGQVEVAPRLIPPGGAGEIRVQQPLATRLGQASYRYAIVTDESPGKRYRVTLTGFVQSAYDPERLQVDFGVVDASVGATRRFDLLSRETQRLELLAAPASEGSASAQAVGRVGVAEEGLRLEIALGSEARLGYLVGMIVLRTNVARQPQLGVQYRAHIVGDVRPGENPLQLGLIQDVQDYERTVPLRSVSGTAFRIERVEDTADGIRTEIVACADKPGPDCSALTLRLGPVAERSRLDGELRIWVSGQSRPIHLAYRGVVAPEGARVKRVLIDDDGESAR